jgi:hypothetical protein
MEVRFGSILIAFEMPDGQCSYRVIDPLTMGAHGKWLHTASS